MSGSIAPDATAEKSDVYEQERVRALRSYRILDTEPEAAFDEIARLAAWACRMPMAFISFVDESRQWFKSHVGFDRAETPRALSFSAHALGQREIFTVPDARHDPRFAANPLVTGVPFLRFYAGAPLIGPQGHVLGALCVYDRKARDQLSEEEKEALRVLSRSVMALLEVRLSASASPFLPGGFPKAFERVSDAVVALNREWEYTYVNAQAGRLFGRNPQDLVGKKIWEEYPDGVGEKFHLAYEKALAEQQPASIEDYYPPFERWYENRIFPSADGLTIYFHDITARKQAERFFQGQVKILEAISGDSPLGECLDQIVRLIEAQAEGLLGSIVLLEPDGLHLQHGAAPSLPADYARALDECGVGPCAGSCGTAIYRREPVFVEDIATDPLWANWSWLAAKHGLRACWSTPIFDAWQRALGAFAIYYRNVGAPKLTHLELVETATHLAAIAITRHRTESELRQSKAALRETAARLDAATHAGRIGIWDRNFLTGMIVCSDTTARMLGLPPTTTQASLEKFEACIHPSDRATLRQAVDRAIMNHTAYTHEFRVVWPDGSVHWVAGRAEASYDAAGQPVRLIGVLTDITDRKRMEDESIVLTNKIRAFAVRGEKVREEERTLIAREIHDVLAQELTRVKIDLVWIAKRVAQPIPTEQCPAVIARVEDALAQTDTAITAVQKIATELRPVVLDRLGLTAAIEWQAEDFARRTGIPCTAKVPPGFSIDGPRATALFRILQESLTNVARHARASAVEIVLLRTPETLLFTVTDNGVGITSAQIDDPASIGLVGIRERAMAFNGQAEFRGAAGGGTTVSVQLPLGNP